MSKKGTLLMAGLAAFAYYKYKKMSTEEKENITNKVKSTGQKIIDGLPDELKNIFGGKDKATV